MGNSNGKVVAPHGAGAVAVPATFEAGESRDLVPPLAPLRRPSAHTSHLSTDAASPAIHPDDAPLPRSRRSSSASALSACANCKTMFAASCSSAVTAVSGVVVPSASRPSTAVTGAAGGLLFCSKECYWSHHVRCGLDDEPEGSMRVRSACKGSPEPDSYVHNRTVQRSRRSGSLSQASALAQHPPGHESPRSRASMAGVGVGASSTSRESADGTLVSPRSAGSRSRGAPSSGSPVLDPYAYGSVEEFGEELDDSLPTPPCDIPRTPQIKALKPFTAAMQMAT